MPLLRDFHARVPHLHIEISTNVPVGCYVISNKYRDFCFSGRAKRRPMKCPKNIWHYQGRGGSTCIHMLYPGKMAGFSCLFSTQKCFVYAGNAKICKVSKSLRTWRNNPMIIMDMLTEVTSLKYIVKAHLWHKDASPASSSMQGSTKQYPTIFILRFANAVEFHFVTAH